MTGLQGRLKHRTPIVDTSNPLSAFPSAVFSFPSLYSVVGSKRAPAWQGAAQQTSPWSESLQPHLVPTYHGLAFCWVCFGLGFFFTVNQFTSRVGESRAETLPPRQNAIRGKTRSPLCLTSQPRHVCAPCRKRRQNCSQLLMGVFSFPTEKNFNLWISPGKQQVQGQSSLRPISPPLGCKSQTRDARKQNCVTCPRSRRKAVSREKRSLKAFH